MDTSFTLHVSIRHSNTIADAQYAEQTIATQIQVETQARPVGLVGLVGLAALGLADLDNDGIPTHAEAAKLIGATSVAPNQMLQRASAGRFRRAVIWLQLGLFAYQSAGRKRAFTATRQLRWH